MRYRLLALDMDGTLLTSDKRISPGTLKALERCARAGVAVALCTGRGPAELDAYRESLDGVVRYGALISGGLAYDLSLDEPLAVDALDADLIAAILKWGEVEDAMPHMLTPYASVVRRRDVERMDSVGMGIYQGMFASCCDFEDDLLAYARKHEGEVVKVNLYHATPEARDRTRKHLEDLPLALANAESTSVESTALGVNKARGLEMLCRHLGCTLEECVAVGDAANDVEALEAAGLAVAMGNATPDVRALADVVVADNDHDGIAEVVDRILLEA